MEWLRETQWLWWVSAALVLGLIEIASLELVFIMLAAAAVAAALAAGLGASITVQVLTFVAAASLLLAVLRPVALRKIKPEGDAQRTNADALVGRTALVLEEVTDRAGLVKLTGETWTARASADTRLPVDETVQVVRIEGATAIVAPMPAADPTTAPQGDHPGSSAPTPEPMGDHPGNPAGERDENTRHTDTP